MRHEGFVTMWLGECDSAMTLEAYVRLNYSDDGQLVPSQLMRDFDIPSYDENFREAEFLEEPSRRIRSLLHGFSYDQRIVANFEAICGEAVDFDVNAVVLLYNYYLANPNRAVAGSGVVRLRYMGVTKYKE